MKFLIVLDCVFQKYMILRLLTSPPFVKLKEIYVTAFEIALGTEKSRRSFAIIPLAYWFNTLFLHIILRTIPQYKEH
jgi:hypothetical protein